ncbi:MAG: TRAP transporter small permease subunit [Lachnospiraceae bacterium]|nr:TRAP transporter small permease subunit [Lachnospiraceae bacterium]
MEKFKKAIDFIENIIIDLCVFFLLGIIIIIVYQVIARAMNISTSGTEEMARYLYVLFVFLLWPVAAKRGQDLRITVLYDLLGPRVRSIVMGVFNLFMAAIGGLIMYSIILNIQLSIKNKTVLPSNPWMQLSIIQIIVAVGLCLTILSNIMRAIQLFAGEITIRTQQEENEAEMAVESAKIEAELEAEKETGKEKKGGKPS